MPQGMQKKQEELLCRFKTTFDAKMQSDIIKKTASIEDSETVDPPPIPTIDNFVVKLPYQLTATYDEDYGKFGVLFGNIAVIDCHYFFDAFLEALKIEAGNYEEEYPDAYQFLI